MWEILITVLVFWTTPSMSFAPSGVTKIIFFLLSSDIRSEESILILPQFKMCFRKNVCVMCVCVCLSVCLTVADRSV